MIFILLGRFLSLLSRATRNFTCNILQSILLLNFDYCTTELKLCDSNAYGSSKVHIHLRPQYNSSVFCIYLDVYMSRYMVLDVLLSTLIWN